MTTESVFDSKFFSPEFRNWLMTADFDEIYSEVSDSYKEEYGIRPSWMYGHTREQFAQYFIWCAQAKIDAIEDEAWESNVRNHPLEVIDPEPYPYDEYDVT